MAKIETIPPYAKAIMWVAGIFMPLFLILPFFFYGGTDITGHTLDETELQAGNLAPFGKLTLSSDIPVEAVAAVLDVQATYDKVCAACHATGISGAPVQGNQAAWQAKIDERGSVEALAEQGIKGINAMPAKGGAAISDEDFKKMVSFMLIKADIDTGSLPVAEGQ